ncbi:anti-sigma factor domain-containing protein [Metabacillus litoralis]|uniref:anti-sigma factor n=1 Tax=Metabacillus litoralis TaxID=152268 RepID=UPI001CFCE7E8|nr:anti-sigma factor [Metabacillus litoralis]
MNNEKCYQLFDYFNLSLAEEDMKQFEQHLQSCPECQQELAELTSLTEDLPYLSEPVDVPKDMKARIFDEIFKDEIVDKSPVIETDQKPSVKQKARKTPRFMIPSLAAALIISLITNAYLFQENKEKSPSGIAEIEPSSQVTLLPVEENNEAVAIVSLLSNKNEETLLLQASNLPKLNAEEVYQVWVIEGDQPYPAGAFQPNESGQGTLSYSLKELEGKWDTVAITVEKEENLPLPEGEVVLAGAL